MRPDRFTKKRCTCVVSQAQSTERSDVILEYGEVCLIKYRRLGYPGNNHKERWVTFAGTYVHLRCLQHNRASSDVRFTSWIIGDWSASLNRLVVCRMEPIKRSVRIIAVSLRLTLFTLGGIVPYASSVKTSSHCSAHKMTEGWIYNVLECNR